MIVVKEFPRASELNSILYDIVYENVHGGGRYGEKIRSISNFNEMENVPTISDWDLHNLKETDELTSWISRILPDVSKNFASKQKPIFGLQSHEDEEAYDFNVNGFEIGSCWGIHYNKNDGIGEHNHFPALLSFVYYVRIPEGSDPFMFKGEAIWPEEGQCLFFLSSEFHSMFQNGHTDGRCAIVGNIIYNDYIHYGGYGK